MTRYSWQITFAKGNTKTVTASSVRALVKRYLGDYKTSMEKVKTRDGMVVEADIYKGTTASRTKYMHVKMIGEDVGIKVKAGAAMLDFQRAVEEYSEKRRKRREK